MMKREREKNAVDTLHNKMNEHNFVLLKEDYI